MGLYKRVINGNEYILVNESWSNSRAWGHRTTLFKNGVELAENKVRYYNRTWECYQYQTCMKGCVYQLIEKRADVLKETFKEKNNIQRLSSKTKEAYLEFRDEDSEYKELKELYESL